MSDPDFNLLTALDALLDLGSVSAAAQRLGLSTSAMSRTLSRLRDQLGDPVLVSAGRKMVPTPHAEAIRDRVRALQEGVSAILQPAPGFNVRDLKRTFTLRANEAFVVSFAARLVAAAAARAPGVQLRFVPKSDKDIKPLRDGMIDLDIGVISPDAGELRARMLYRDHFVGVARAGHPVFATSSISTTDYCAYDHVVATRRGRSFGLVDEALARHGLARNIRAIVSSFPAVLSVVISSDLIGLVPQSSCLGGLAHQLFDLSSFRTFELPVKTESITVSQIWHPRVDADPAHRWLRGMVVEICAMREASGEVILRT